MPLEGTAHETGRRRGIAEQGHTIFCEEHMQLDWLSAAVTVPRRFSPTELKVPNCEPHCEDWDGAKGAVGLIP